MAGPWEEYQTKSGPWEEYQAPKPSPAPQEKMGFGKAALTGAETAFKEPYYGAAELLPGAVGRYGARGARETEQQWQKAVQQQPTAARLGYWPTTLAMSAVPEAGIAKVADVATALKATPAVGAAIGALTPTGKESIGQRYAEKALPTALGAVIPYGISKAPIVAKAAKAAVKPLSVITKIEKPSSISEVGEAIDKKVNANLDSLISKRQKEAKKLYDDYLAAGKKVEGNILADYKSGLNNYYASEVSAGKMTPDQARALVEASKRVEGVAADLAGAAKVGKGGAATVQPGIGALEKERRILNEISQGFEVKGAEAISARTAQDISNILTQAIEKHVPNEFRAADEGYKTLSAPINRYNTMLGKKLTTEAGEFLPDITKVDAQQIPGAFFKSRRSVNELKDLTGDPTFVEDVARKHVANDLSRATTSAQIEKYISDNSVSPKDWLQEFPAIQKQLIQASKELKNAERLKTTGKIGATAALGAGAFNYLKGLF
jgi:hypothetical protein